MTGPLKNARHERFAQELAKGKSASEAYVLAGYEANDGNAIRLKGNEKVAARIEALKARAAERTVVTVASLTERLLKIAAKGEGEDVKDAPLLSVARASLMDVAKLNGLIVDKRVNVDLSNLSDEELENLAGILAKTANA